MAIHKRPRRPKPLEKNVSASVARSSNSLQLLLQELLKHYGWISDDVRAVHFRMSLIGVESFVRNDDGKHQVVNTISSDGREIIAAPVTTYIEYVPDAKQSEGQTTIDDLL